MCKEFVLYDSLFEHRVGIKKGFIIRFSHKKNFFNQN